MIFKCEECGQEFPTKTGLANHSRKHKKTPPRTSSIDTTSRTPSIDTVSRTSSIDSASNQDGEQTIEINSTGSCNETETKELSKNGNSGTRADQRRQSEQDDKQPRSKSTINVKQDVFTCNECERTFPSRKGLSNHRRSHYQAPAIRSNTPSINGLMDESEMFTRDSPDFMSTTTSINVHMNTTTSLIYTRNSYDNSGHLADNDSVEKESTNMKPDRVNDDDSHEQETQIDQLDSMVRSLSIDAETKTTKDVFTCKTCKRSFSSKRGLSNHKRSHFKNPTNTASNLGPAGTPVNGIIGEIKSQKDGNGELRTDKLTSGNQSEDELPPFISTEKKNPTESNRMFVEEEYNEEEEEEEEEESEDEDEFLSCSVIRPRLMFPSGYYHSSSTNGDYDIADDVYHPSESMTPSKGTNGTTTTRRSKFTDRRILGIEKENRLANSAKSEAAKVVNTLMTKILDELKNLSPELKWDTLNTGSYYDLTKNKLPDEFDIMIYPTSLRVSVDYGSRSTVKGYHKVKVDSPRPPKDIETMIREGFLHPKEFKDYVFGKLDDLLSSAKHREFRNVTRLEKDDDSSPAYTIRYDRIAGHPIHIDIVPSFKIGGKCPIARPVDPKWITNKDVVNKLVEWYDIVSKTCPDETAQDRDLLWRVSFANNEKLLITHAADGNRYSFKKRILKLMKNHIQEIKGLYNVKKFCSYHIKQFMLRRFDEWQDGKIEKIHDLVLREFIKTLSRSPPFIENYFIEGDNVIKFVPQSEIDLIVTHLKKSIHGV